MSISNRLEMKKSRQGGRDEKTVFSIDRHGRPILLGGDPAGADG